MSSVINSISGKVLLAPLAGITNLPFRLLARSFGCALSFTEMISANGLIRESKKTAEYLRTCPEDTPLGIQIFGADPAIMAQAAAIVSEHHPDLIDINMGCPVKKVIKAGAGAILMKDPSRIANIIIAVKKTVSVPVSIKIRSGWSRSSINAVEIARIAEDCGAAAIIVHPRTADQGFSGEADWKIIAEVKKSVRIPVIGNGDIRQPQNALRMSRETGCDAVMVGRGALGNPWIFQGIEQVFSGQEENYLPLIPQRLEIIKKHWEMEAAVCGNKLADRSFRKHILWYTRGLKDSSRFREEAGKMTDRGKMLQELDKYFQLLEEAQAEIMT